jgi:type I restriction enzyme S subunit
LCGRVHPQRSWESLGSTLYSTTFRALCLLLSIQLLTCEIQAKYKPVGIPVIRGSNLSLGLAPRFQDEDFVYVSAETARRLARSLCKPGDIIFTKKGTLGQTGIVPKQYKHKTLLLSSNQMKLSVDTDIADPLFVYYFVSSPTSREKIIRDSEATGVPKINLEYLRAFPITLPPLPTQRRIAEILGHLDDKIELNRRLNRKLEEMAQALYKHHFVDFGPYQDGEFVESELDLIPQGWKVGCVEDWGEVITGKTPSTSVPDYFGDDIPFIKIPDMHGKVFVTQTASSLSLKGANSQQSKFLPPMSICVSCIATPGLVSLTSAESQTNQQINSIIPRKNTYAEFLYLQMSEFGDEIRTLGSGGTATLNLNKGDFSNIRVIIPPDEILSEFHRRVKPWFEQVLNLEYENRKLAEIRDYLLPKLLSGEIEV